MSSVTDSKGGDAQHGVQNGGSTNGARANGYHAYSGAVKDMPDGQKSPAKAGKNDNWTWSHFRRASRRPLPTELGGGSYRDVAKRPSLLQDIRSIGLADLKTVQAILGSKLKGETQMDDKTMVMERTIKLVAALPNASLRQEILTNSFIGMMWDSIAHPPLLYMGNEFRYRQPDGSNNNPTMPKLGAAGQPYSRTVKPGKANAGALPDPELIYEAVMARDKFKTNPNHVSSILWYWATIIIHDVFWTNTKDPNVNDSSSYLDLAPLYGHSKEAVDSIRTFEDGKLKPDTFADRRLIGNPPGVCIILIMFNRFHNYIADKLAAINEQNRFPKPQANLDEEAAAAAWKKYDEDLFQTARLVTSGMYMNVTLIDYVRNIINLNRVDSTWTLDPRQEMGVSVGTSTGTESGVGNCVSAEFNLCYRWHSCISEMDERWIEDFYKELLGDNYGEMNLQTLIGAVKKFEMSMPKDPAEYTFNGFVRGADGRFSDDDLVNAFATAIEQPGGAFGAKNVPRCMKPVEILGIIRGRKWHLAGLNEFRKHFGLKPYATFEDINPDPAVADQLRCLYQHPDHVELYPGIVAEDAKKPMVPGVGIAPTYTLSRVILSDAVSLIRGDRYYTTDYHPGYLTQWGYNEVNYDMSINNGCSFYKLLMRSFPNHFQPDSVYAHLPMATPSENRSILKTMPRLNHFCFDRPRFKAPIKRISSYAGARYVLNNEDKYCAGWQEGLNELFGHPVLGTLPSEDQKHLHSLLREGDWLTPFRDLYASIAEGLLSEKVYMVAGRPFCDVVRDYGNLAHVHFVARLFNLPLKSPENRKGVFSEQELYTALTTIFVALYHDRDPVRSYSLRLKAKKLASELGSIVETNVKLSTSLGLSGFFTSKPKDDYATAYGAKLIKGLSKAGLKPHEITWGQIIPTAGTLVPNESLLFAQAISFYMRPEGQSHVEEISRIAVQASSQSTDALLLGYALEGVRMSGPADIFRRASAADVITEDNGESINVQAGDEIVVSFVSTARDSAHFPRPETVDPRRPVDSYVHILGEPNMRLGEEVTHVALVALFRALFRKKGLKSMPGAQGELKSVTGPDGHRVFMTEDWGGFWPLPVSMKLTWEAD